MDLQNVKNLTIPEGSVKTIHDKDSRLLWGAVGYDTKYAGDTTQQTYKGVNLFNKDAALSNQYLNGSGGWTSGTYSFVNQEYTGVTATQISVSFTNRFGNAYVRLGEYKSDDTFIQRELITTNTTVTLASETAKIIISVDNASGTRFENLQVEYGSTATSYEPYTGGIPAPNPDYPQAVQTATGEQTVTVSDGVDSEAFTVNLGSTELCKIGDYQDYIYKSGNDWYVHKETNKFTVTSSLALGKSGTSANNAYYYSSGFQDIDKTNMGSGSSSTSVIPSFSAYFGAISARDIFNSGSIGMAFDKGTGDIVDFRVGFGVNSTVNTLELLKSWLDANELKVYYPLATPTNTQITDTTLISQLNAVHGWLTRYGYNATVSGDLPIVLQRDSLQ